MNCKPAKPFDEKVKPEDVQILENELRAFREATMEALDLAVAKALDSGLSLTDMIIEETTVWSDSEKEFTYKCLISKKVRLN